MSEHTVLISTHISISSHLISGSAAVTGRDDVTTKHYQLSTSAVVVVVVVIIITVAPLANILEIMNIYTVYRVYPAEKHVLRLPFSFPSHPNQPHDNPIPTHITCYIFHFHPIAGFAPNRKIDGQTLATL